MVLSKLLKKLSGSSANDSNKDEGVYLVSFPKSGRSWLRLMMCHTVYEDYPLPAGEDPTEFLTERLHEQHEKIPQVIITHDDNPEYKTVAELDREKKEYTGKKVILLVRDPRDIIISWYFHLQYRGIPEQHRSQMHAEVASDIITNERGGLETIVEFYNIWAEKLSVADEYLIVRYEDLQSDSGKYLRQLFDFMGCGDVISEKAIQKAVDMTEFEKVKKAEAENKIKHAAFVTTDVKNKDAYKARRGVVGGYTDYLSEDEIKKMNEIIDTKLNKVFGY